MRSAWHDTELDIYEGHVELETVGQAAAIRQVIAEAIRSYAPGELLYLGCAGGNGVEVVNGTRVVGLDLNERFIEKARERWGHLAGSEWICCDLNETLPQMGKFELAFGALVFEYIDDLPKLLQGLAAQVSGHMVVMLLGTREGAPAVTASPYKSALEGVGKEFRYLSTEGFLETATGAGFALVHQHEIPLPGGKHFKAITLRRRL